MFSLKFPESFFKYTKLFCIPILFFLAASGAHAQFLLPDTTKNQEAAVPAWPEDSLGRRTPRGAVEGFIKAVSSQDYVLAGKYLHLDTAVQKEENRLKLSQGLQYLLEKNGRLFPYSRLSNEPEGAKDDDLPLNQDQVGVASINDDSFDLMMESVEGPDGGPLWLFSSQTLQKIPLPVEQVIGTSVVNKLAPKVLEEKLWAGVPVAHWLGILIIIVLAYLLAGLIIRLIIFLIPYIWKKAKDEPLSGVIQSFSLPLRLYLAVWIFVVVSRETGISIIVRQRFSDLTLIAGAVAFLLLLWQLMNFSSRYFEKRMMRKGNHSAISAILFLRRAAKVALVVLGVMIILDTFGFNVTTWLAGLGIVGIALALGTQKTVENFVGSVTLIADQPVRVGDFCKAGDVTGTIEQIGMRTTRIRTNDRTIVTIPNGEFSSMKIENFSPRDRFLFNPAFMLKLETSTAQIKTVLEKLRAILLAHPKVNPDPARVRLVGVTMDGYKIEVFSFIDTIDGNEFMEIQETLYLQMMDAVAESGAGFSLPSQTVYLSNQEDKEVKQIAGKAKEGEDKQGKF
jgi:MscS family membrane protein